MIIIIVGVYWTKIELKIQKKEKKKEKRKKIMIIACMGCFGGIMRVYNEYPQNKNVV